MGASLAENDPKLFNPVVEVLSEPRVCIYYSHKSKHEQTLITHGMYVLRILPMHLL